MFSSPFRTTTAKQQIGSAYYCTVKQSFLSSNTNSQFERRVLSSIVVSVFSWLVRQGTAVWQPPDTPHKVRGKPLTTPKKPPPYATTGM
ncbi:MAG: hypothetical protein NTW61_03885 [Candidatus Melainabacteria bacterium]|nr:hypothetical protein [Candidatus Melainabacteria bacterium]